MLQKYKHIHMLILAARNALNNDGIKRRVVLNEHGSAPPRLRKGYVQLTGRVVDNRRPENNPTLRPIPNLEAAK